MGLHDGSQKALSSTNLSFPVCDAQNSMLMHWLIQWNWKSAKGHNSQINLGFCESYLFKSGQ